MNDTAPGTQPSGMPIRRRLMRILLLTSGIVTLLTCLAFLAQDVFTYRQTTLRNLTTLGAVVATNSTAALAFENAEDATEVLKALRAEPHIAAAALYDAHGRLFAKYPADQPDDDLPGAPAADGYLFGGGTLSGFQPVLRADGQRLGTLYVRSDMRALRERLVFAVAIAVVVLAGSLLIAYLISRRLQSQISQPLLALAETARAISDRRDYSVRAAPQPALELNLLTEAFNHMLTQIQDQARTDRAMQKKLQDQLGRLELLHRITRAIGERQDLRSIFQVVIRSLEDSMPIDLGAICLYDAAAETLTVSGVGSRTELSETLGLRESARIDIDQNGLLRCLRGTLVYEPDTAKVQFPFPQRMARGGLQSLVIAPLLAESKVFGLLLAARHESASFTSGDCEFLRQLSEHVALAAHQAQLYTALQSAYDDLRQSQQTVLQQERLRALGQMASGIAHDINNALSPVSLYTESLLERESNLSTRAREYLQTIQQAVDDVSSTVARMREFYRPREPQLVLGSVDLNKLARSVIDLTRARWRDLPQQQGIAIELRIDLAPDVPRIMGGESEIRDALTNLIFNAVDAMPQGGVLGVGTEVLSTPGLTEEETLRHVRIEVTDSGVGMSEETRRRCLEPFYTTKGERGTGLGLAMVFGMVQRHSAELEIDSETGKGTTVRLVFPVPSEVLSSTQRIPASAIPVRRLRILVVDDDPLLIRSLRDTLEADGHAVVAADGGQAGIDAFMTAQHTTQPFAAVITDLGMPYVDGRRVASTIRALAPDVAIILLTGWGSRLIAEEDVPDGVDRVLSKPPRLHELRAALAELTNRAAATGT